MSSPPLTPTREEPTSDEGYRFRVTGTPCEWAESYRPGGFHPVHLGDVLANRYEVIRKLGNGSFGTVWLALDSMTSAYVALKIEVAGRHEPRELPIQQFLAKKLVDGPFSRHVVKLLDSFHLDGPNGRHLCLVLEPMGPSVSTILNAPHETYDPLNPPVRRFETDKTKRILRNVLAGLQFLHSNGVVHGDLQSGNILFALQDLSTVGPEKLKQDERTSRIDYLHRIDGKPDKWAPRYLAASQPLSEYTVKEPNDDTKLSDLGGAFFINEPPEKVVTPRSLRAPELILGEPFGIGVDIWSFGCLVFELVTGTPLFQLPPFGLSGESLKDEHLIQLTDIIGPLPENLIRKWPASSTYYGSRGERLNTRPRDFDKDDFDQGDDGHEDAEGGVVGFYNNDNEDAGFDIGGRVPPQTLDSLEKLIGDNKAADVDEAEENKMASLLRSIFQYDPAKRPSAADLLDHVWLKG